MDSALSVTQMPGEPPFDWRNALRWYIVTFFIAVFLLMIIRLLRTRSLTKDRYFFFKPTTGAVALWILSCFVLSTGLYFSAANRHSRRLYEREPHSQGWVIGLIVVGVVGAVLGFFLLFLFDSCPAGWTPDSGGGCFWSTQTDEA